MGLALKQNPDVCNAIKNGDYEIAAHGYRWIDYQNVKKTIEKKHIVVCLDNHFFISADNGILSILCQNINPEKIFEITIHDELNKIDSSSKIFSQG